MQVCFKITALVMINALSISSLISAESSLGTAAFALKTPHMESHEAMRSLRARHTSTLNVDEERLRLKLLRRVEYICEKIVEAYNRVKNRNKVFHVEHLPER
ncbi:hypothetical protein CCR75_005890 [Bremia lactucae]|uniref:RxLR effector protein n=1 Tax=Bremia lactucae TaxID=4779 RepID=A0A976FLW2_BRELC|nr:hypothetical protein CCR75_005890 [Bremia lactucae]